MSDLEIMGKVIIKMVNTNGLALIAAVTLWIVVMVTITNIKKDKSWVKKMMGGIKK